MLSGLLFGYQLDRLNRWRRLSPVGKVWWAFRKAVMIAIVVAVLSTLYLYNTYTTAVAPVVDGTASVLTLAGPLLASLPILAAIVLVSTLVVLIPTRREGHWNR